MKRVYTCPLGHECEKAVNGELQTCAWFIGVMGKDAQGNDHNESKCALAWMPILLIENASTNRGQTAALESFRNETTKSQNEFLNIISGRKALK